MPQRSIGSFFTKKNPVATTTNTNEKEKENTTSNLLDSPKSSIPNDEASPVKGPKKTAKKRRIESDDDDDEEDHPSKKSLVETTTALKNESAQNDNETQVSSAGKDGIENDDCAKTPPPKRKTARKTVVGPSSTKSNKGEKSIPSKLEKEASDLSSSSEVPTSVKVSPKKDDIKKEKEESPSSSKEKTSQGSFFTKSPAVKEGKSKVKVKSEDDDKKQTDESSSNGSKEKKTSQGSFFTKSPGVNKESKSKAKVKPEDYNPGKDKYHPIEDACWGYGERVPYLALSKTFEEIEAISARLKITSILCNFLRSVIVLTPDELLPCLYLCLNKLAPAYEGVELGIGEHLLMKAVCSVTGKSVKEMKAQVGEKGDLGIVAESCKSNQRVMFAPPPLTVTNVFKRLKDIALMTGNACMGKKQEKIQGMFVACKHSEARYLIRSLGGKLRIGLAEQSVLTALGNAVALTPPGQKYPPEILNVSSSISDDLKKEMSDATLSIKTAYCELPTYDVIVKNLLESGWEKLSETCHITPGIPLKPMLAHPTTGIGEVLKRFDNTEFTCEYKYDGERAQIHLLESGDVNIYSRNQENNTTKYPDIISRIPSVLEGNVKSFIIDTESVAWDTEKKQILPFQVLTTRKRKDVDAKDIKVQVCVYAFDILYLNGESLVRKPFRERRELLKSTFKEIEGEFVFATAKTSSDTDEISQFLEESIQGNCEGLMVKTLDTDATYEIAKRSHNWLKLKKDYLDGVGDTLDLVVIGGYLGTGKRTGKYGGFLLACYDDENEEYQSICKTGTGFTDEQLAQHYEFLKGQVIDKPKSYFNCGDIPSPDHWFEPVQVWEIKAADLSISPIYKAAVGIVDPDKGISLRFPRFIRIRDDKKTEEATNCRQVAEFYNSQQQIQNANKDKTSKGDDDAFY